ncbi:DUF108 domain-containing protein [Candidatus Woesearchaeota archaeon]|nr:DUF108 domain-containing protein [Candidatus Woesearchaeota archaeon]
MKVGVIGCGFIGNELSVFIDRNKEFKLIGLNDIDKDKSDFLIKKLKNNNPKFMSYNELIKKSDLIIESASKDAVEEILKNKNLDENHKYLLIMSTGGLIDNLDLLKQIKNCIIHLPSGAIAGLDAIKAASGRIKYLELTTTKPIKALENSPYVTKNKINLKRLKTQKFIFQGNLKDAIEGFPQNINVAATLFLASKFDDIKVSIIADPFTKLNRHEIICQGDFGRIMAITENMPSKNPKTSYLAVLSAINILKNLKSNVKIGN